MNESIQKFLANKRFVLLGASTNPQKYGNIILHKMRGHGYEVFPVNPRAEAIDGLKCFASLKDVPGDKTMVNVVLPAGVTLKLIPQFVENKVKIVWLQPGAESVELQKELEKAGIAVIADGACIMVAAITNSVAK